MVKSSFWGKIDEIPGICIDNFENPHDNVRAYFLSHAHTDHTVGLYSNALKTSLLNKAVFIYMSEATAAIINYESDGLLKDYIKPLKLGTSLITLPRDSSNDTELYIEVCLLPAGHCFGSVMFLYKTKHKTVLYTGDFRMSCSDVSKYNHLHENGHTVTLDALYIDTTFHHEKYNVFPKRSECVVSLMKEIENWLKRDGNKIALHVSAKYGYEFLFNEIYKRLNLKVYVDDAKWQLYRTVTDLVPGVTNDVNGSRIHLCRNRIQHFSHIKCIDDENSNFLFIHFSAIIWEGYEHLDNPIQWVVPGERLNICFPTHCSNQELMYFVSYLKPKRVVGFPNEFKCVEITEEVKIVPKKRVLKRKKQSVYCTS